MQKHLVQNMAATLVVACVLSACELVTAPASQDPSTSPLLHWTPVGEQVTSLEGTYLAAAFSPDGTYHLLYSDSGSGYSPTLVKFTANDWYQVGTDGFATNSVLWQSLAFNSQGQPYVAVCESGYENPQNATKISVLTYASGDWSYVGTAGDVSDEGAKGVSLAFDSNDVPYVAYVDLSNDESRVTVKKFDEGSWQVVGTQQFSGTVVVDDNLSQVVALAIDDDTPYVALRENIQTATTDNVISVLKYNTTWQPLGETGEATDGADVGAYLSFVVADGVPYLAYQDLDHGKALVTRYKNGAWTLIGSEGPSVGGADFLALAVSSGVPYLAFQDSSNGGRAIVKRFVNSRWTSATTNSASGSKARYLSLQLSPNGTPYLAYQDGINGNRPTVVKAVP